MSNKLAKPMANKIVVDDGSKVYTIENKKRKGARQVRVQT